MMTVCPLKRSISMMETTFKDFHLGGLQGHHVAAKGTKRVCLTVSLADSTGYKFGVLR